MAAYPQMFVRAHLVPDSGKYRDALRALQDLDKEATDERVAYYRMEDALLRKAGKLLSSKDVSEGDLQKFFELPELLELEAKRQHILERRSHAQKLATDAYDQVDATIQKLDAEMVQLEPQAAMAQPLVGPGSKKKSKSWVWGSLYMEQKSADKSKLSVQLPLYDPVGRPEDLVIDPNEPLYCVCRKVSFGQMVGCDNDDCQYEWFHFECVGLTERPTGTWFCPDCRKRQL